MSPSLSAGLPVTLDLRTRRLVTTVQGIRLAGLADEAASALLVRKARGARALVESGQPKLARAVLQDILTICDDLEAADVENAVRGDVESLQRVL